MTIRLHIDRLVLEGAAFARMDRARLGAVVQAQLAALLRNEMNVDALSAHHGAAAIRAEGATATSGGPGRGGRAAARVPAEATAAQWGQHIARAVHGALTSDGRGESRSAAWRGQRDTGARDGGGARSGRSGHGGPVGNGGNSLSSMGDRRGRGGTP